MNVIRKEEMHELELEELEDLKNRLFLQVSENRKLVRNVLYELLGVIDFKRKIAIGA